MKDIKSVIFDWDGTLADTRPLVVAAMNKTLSDYHLPDWDYIKKKKRDPSKSLKENFPNFFGKNAKVAYAKYLDHYQKYFDLLTSCTGAKALLKHLLQINLPIYIASNKEKSLLLYEVNTLFPSIRFTGIFGDGDAPQNKPHPAPLIKIAHGAGLVLPRDPVLIIGDSQQDITAAYAAGCIPILIGKGLFMNAVDIKKQQKANPPLQIYPSLMALSEYL